jgi:hypothetical protein
VPGDLAVTVDHRNPPDSRSTYHSGSPARI